MHASTNCACNRDSPAVDLLNEAVSKSEENCVVWTVSVAIKLSAFSASFKKGNYEGEISKFGRWHSDCIANKNHFMLIEKRIEKSIEKTINFKDLPIHVR